MEALHARGLRLYLASGTDQQYMREEAGLLDMARYFDGRVYGALDDYRSFSKKILIERLIASSEFQGAEFLGFGDGFVEIENIKEVGGVAVGVATAEPECQTVDEWKQRRRRWPAWAPTSSSPISPAARNCSHTLFPSD